MDLSPLRIWKLPIYQESTLSPNLTNFFKTPLCSLNHHISFPFYLLEKFLIFKKKFNRVSLYMMLFWANTFLKKCLLLNSDSGIIISFIDFKHTFTL